MQPTRQQPEDVTPLDAIAILQAMLDEPDQDATGDAAFRWSIARKVLPSLIDATNEVLGEVAA